MWQNGVREAYLVTYCVVFEEKVAPLILDKTQEGEDEDYVALGRKFECCVLSHTDTGNMGILGLGNMGNLD